MRPPTLTQPRARVLLGLVLGLLLATGCASSAPAPSAPARAEPPSVASQTSPPAPVAAGTGAAGATTAPATATTGWQAEWDRLVAAARREGKVMVAGPPGDLYRRALTSFQQAYPDVEVHYTGASGATFVPRLLSERQGEQYLWDVLVSASGQAAETLLPAGALDPLTPALVLPEVLADASWAGGFADGWMDVGQSHIYGFQGQVLNSIHVNRDLVPEVELRTVEELVEPRWRGKISFNDPRQAGSGVSEIMYWVLVFDDDYLRRVLGQDVGLTQDLRQQVEWLVRGRYPIGVGVDTRQLLEFQREGLGKNVSILPYRPGVKPRMSTGFGSVMLMNRAPQPNAARLFVNWLLSPAGQAAWVEATDIPSRRLDVAAGAAEERPVAGVDYIIVNKQEYQPVRDQAVGIAREVLR
jgi:iron(III) transport system substrate-binding protein